MTVQQECEIILAMADASELQKVAAAAVWRPAVVRFQSNTRLTDWYWDTPDYKLVRAGWAIRLRVTGKDAQMQAKSLHPSDIRGLNVREEFHQPARVNFNGLLATLAAGPVSLLIAEVLGQPLLDIELTPLFAATRMRKTYKILSNPMAFLMLDSGAIHRPGAQAPEVGALLKEFFRFEIEGDPAAREQLLGWAQGLVAEIGAEITPVSKYELAWQALNLPEEVLALGREAASRHPLAVDQPAPAATVESAEPAASATPVKSPAKVAPEALAGEQSAVSKPLAHPKREAEPQPKDRAPKREAGKVSGTVTGSAGALVMAAARDAAGPASGSGGKGSTSGSREGAISGRLAKVEASKEAGAAATPPAVSKPVVPLAATPVPPGLARPVSGRMRAVGGGREEELPPMIAHADVGGAFLVTAEPVDTVLDDACHDPATNALKPLEAWPVEFRETCLRREAGGGDFVSPMGHRLRRPPAPESRADVLTQVAGALFDATAVVHRLEVRFRPMLVSLAHLAGEEWPNLGKGPSRWLALRDRIVYHGLPEFTGRQCWMMGLAMGALSREHRDPDAPAWRRLTYEDRQDALRLGALLKLARDFERKAGADWLPTALDWRQSRPVLLVEQLGAERRRLDFKDAGNFWQRVFGEGLPIRRRTAADAGLKPPIPFKPRPLDRKHPIDIFCGQNTGAALVEILTHQRQVFDKQVRKLQEHRSKTCSRTVEAFGADPLIEVIHDYRVALRRLRSYCRLFELPLGRGMVRKMTEPMQELAAPTALLRQVDVLIETVLADGGAGCFRQAGSVAEEPLLEYLLARRVEAVQGFWQVYERSQTTVQRERMHSLLRAERWCWVGRFGPSKLRRAGDEADFDPGEQGGAGRARRAQQTPVEVFAAGSLMQCLGEARILYEAARPDPLHCSFGDLHAVRIGLKKLRYGFELFAPLMGHATHEAIETSKRLQDQLGAINDCEANAHCLLALLAATPPRGRDTRKTVEPVRVAAEVWMTWSRKRIQETRRHLVETWPRLFGRQPVKRLMGDWWN